MILIWTTCDLWRLERQTDGQTDWNEDHFFRCSNPQNYMNLVSCCFRMSWNSRPEIPATSHPNQLLHLSSNNFTVQNGITFNSTLQKKKTTTTMPQTGVSRYPALREDTSQQTTLSQNPTLYKHHETPETKLALMCLCWTDILDPLTLCGRTIFFYQFQLTTILLL